MCGDGRASSAGGAMAQHLAGLAQESGSRQGVDQGSVGVRNVAMRYPHTAESYGTGHCKEWQPSTTWMAKV